jgi:hypothetical protein
MVCRLFALPVKVPETRHYRFCPSPRLSRGVSRKTVRGGYLGIEESRPEGDKSVLSELLSLNDDDAQNAERAHPVRDSGYRASVGGVDVWQLGWLTSELIQLELILHPQSENLGEEQHPRRVRWSDFADHTGE